MRDFIYRDNREALKDCPLIVSFNDGATETFAPTIYRYPDRAWMENNKKYKQCPHCGNVTKVRGMGMHMRSLRCLAERATIQAALEGYVKSHIQYNSLTSPFARRYPTGLNVATKNHARNEAGRMKITHMKSGSIHMEVWYELWFALLWGKYCRPKVYQSNTTCDYISTPEEQALVKIPGKPGQVRGLQLPEAKYLSDFIDLATAKRKHSKRGLEQAKANLVLTQELSDVPKF